MKVIDGYNDYFDHAGAIDPSIVLDRSAVDTLSTTLEGAIPDLPNGVYVSTSQGYVGAIPLYVLIGGRGIPALHIGDIHSFTAQGMFYDAARIPEAMDRFRQEVQDSHSAAYINAKPNGELEFHSKAFKGFQTACAALFDKGEVDLTQVCADVGIITGIVHHESCALALYPRNRDPKMTFTPMLLRTLGVDAVVEPHIAHMMVSQFVGGVLSSQEEMITLSDTDRLDKAGFDRKTSFRKPKQS